MNLTQVIVYKHRDQQSFVFFNTKAESAHTCVDVLTLDSQIFYDIVYTRFQKIK